MRVTVDYGQLPLVRLTAGEDPVKGRVIELDEDLFNEFNQARDAYVRLLQRIAVLPNAEQAIMIRG